MQISGQSGTTRGLHSTNTRSMLHYIVSPFIMYSIYLRLGVMQKATKVVCVRL